MIDSGNWEEHRQGRPIRFHGVTRWFGADLSHLADGAQRQTAESHGAYLGREPVHNAFLSAARNAPASW